MEGCVKDLSRYRLEKAKEDLLTAELLLKENMLKASINRSYYAIFHSLRAVAVLSGFDSSKHSGIIAFFNKHFVKTGIFAKETSSIIKNVSRLREKSDYDEFYVASKNEASEQLDKAKRLLSQIEEFISQQE